jgi:phage terminase large subunit-like protein
MSRSPKQELSLLPPDVQARWLAEQPDWAISDITAGEWWWTARPEQRHPPGEWFVWLLLSGRGFGKTRTAAEWLVDRVIRYPRDTSGFRTEWLLIAETLPDAMRQCVYGPAGIKRVLERRLGKERKQPGGWWLVKSPKPFIQLYDEHGQECQVVYIEGADDEDVGRGYNAAGAWLDEFAKWKTPDGSWTEGIMPSLRADLPDDYPRVIVATTPKLVVQLVQWEDRRDGSVVITRGSTYDNASNLAPKMLAEFHSSYHGTRLGLQELYGKLIREVQGALWSLDWIERDRVDRVPELGMTVIGMDPAGTGERDETGLVAVGRALHADEDYVLGDWSKQVAGHAAARRAWEMYAKYGADWVVIEAQMAKKWLRDVMVQAYREMQAEGIFAPGGAPPLKEVTAKVGKKLRAEPVAARYEQGGRVHHVRNQGLGTMETQMISWVPEGTKDSPDRIDALVYGELMLYSREARRMSAASPVDFELPVSSYSPLA